MPMISLTAADGFRLQAYRTGPQDAAQRFVVPQEIFGENRKNHASSAALFPAFCLYRAKCEIASRVEKGGK